MSRALGWLRRAFFRTKEAVTHEEVTRRLQEIERGLKVVGLEKPQAEADGVRLSGAAALLESIGDNDAVALVGSVLLVRQRQPDDHHKTFVRTLTQAELIHLEKHPDLLQSPQTILNALSKAVIIPQLEAHASSASTDSLHGC